jgi:hypothetical protein
MEFETLPTILQALAHWLFAYLIDQGIAITMPAVLASLSGFSA